jgi:SAM-dependent methyltransferase
MRWGPEEWDTLALRRPGEPEASTASERALLEFLDAVPGRDGMTVADLGCGAGRLLPFLACRFGKVVAVDYAPASLALARRVSPGKDVVFRRRDLRDLSPFRNAFHTAVAVESIVGPRPEDVDRVLAEVCLSLVEGGFLAAIFPASGTSGRPVPLRLAGDAPGPAPLRFHEVELQYRMRRAGFRGLRIRRFAGDGPSRDALLCIASRRGNN